MPTASHQPLALPADRYAIEREIGRGGYATVYLARDLRHQRRVAIKVLNQSLASEVGLERFQAEIDIAASLAHPNIVPVFDSGAAGDTLFYVMPFIEGESLRQRIERDGALATDDAMRIARDMAHALTYAHSRNVVHRDIKPENILLMQSGGHALVADFGIAKVLSGAQRGRLTVTGSAIGTPLYMSPEQSVGLPVDARSDIYSFAAVVFEMLTGMPPMPGSGARDLLTDTPTGEMPSRVSRPARLPRLVRPVLARALSGEADDRQATVGEFMTQLSDAIDNIDASLLRHLGLGHLRPAQRRMAERVLIAAAALVIVGASSVYAVAKITAVDPAEGRVVIFPFRTTTEAATGWREAIPDLIATQLDGTPGVRVADPWSAWLPLRRNRDDVARSPDPDEARELAERVRACCYVLGSVSQVPGRIDVSVRVYNAGTAEPAHTFTAGGAPDSIGSVVQKLSIELIRRLARGELPAGAPQADLAVPRTPVALKEWLAAREHLRRGRLDSADVAITKSLAEDSSFVLSLTDATAIRSWLQFAFGQPYANLRGLAERAVSLSDSAPERTRLRAEAMLASIRTDGPEVARATSAILAIDPADFDAWNLMSYSHVSYGWQYGVSATEARDAIERLYQLDTTNLTSIARGAYLAVSLNDMDAVRVQRARLRRSDTTAAFARGMLRGIDALIGSDADFARDLPSLSRAASAPEWISVLRLVRLFRPDRTLQLLRTTLADETSPVRPIALGASMQALVSGSRWSVVDSLRATGLFEMRPGFSTAVDRMLVAAALGGAATPARAFEAVTRLAVGMPPDSAQALFDRRSVWQDGWLIGAYHAMYGDTALARRWSAALGAMPPGGSPREYGKSLQADVDSRLSLRRGDRPAALAHARRAYALWDVHSENQLEFLPEPAIRFQFAGLLRDAGRADSARALFSSFVPPTTWMGFHSVRGALELAELEERAGLRRDAERHYMIAARWLELTDADGSAAKARAQAGLRRLGG